MQVTLGPQDRHNRGGHGRSQAGDTGGNAITSQFFTPSKTKSIGKVIVDRRRNFSEVGAINEQPLNALSAALMDPITSMTPTPTTRTPRIYVFEFFGIY